MIATIVPPAQMPVKGYVEASPREPALAVDFDLAATVAQSDCPRCHGTGLVEIWDGIDTGVTGCDLAWPTGEYRACPECSGELIPF